MSDRERQARDEFEKVMRMYLALPEGSYGCLAVHVGADGTAKGKLERFMPPVAERAKAS